MYEPLLSGTRERISLAHQILRAHITQVDYQDGSES